MRGLSLKQIHFYTKGSVEQNLVWEGRLVKMMGWWCDSVSNYGSHHPVCSACLNRKEVNSQRSKSVIGFVAPGFRVGEAFFGEDKVFLWFMHTSLFESGKFCKVGQKLAQTFKILWQILVSYLWNSSYSLLICLVPRYLSQGLFAHEPFFSDTANSHRNVTAWTLNFKQNVSWAFIYV